MRLPVDEQIAISCLFPTLQDHGPFRSIPNKAVAAGHLRSYQRARRRSYHEREIRTRPTGNWDEIHYPFDPFSYHLICHHRGLFSYAQQSRYFARDEQELHLQTLHVMCEHGMLCPEEVDAIKQAVAESKCETVAQIGGWISRDAPRQRRARFLPYYSWALNRLFSMRFAYAPCRVDNGASRFLQKLGAVPLTEPRLSLFYGGEVQILRFLHDAHRRHEPLINEAIERLQQNETIYLGTRHMREKHQVHPLQSTRVRPGGDLCNSVAL